MGRVNCKNTCLVVQKKRQSRESSRSSISRGIGKKRRNNTELISHRRSYRAMLRYLAQAGLRIASTNSRGETALHLAVKRDDPEAASQLVRLGADVNRKNLRGETPLQMVVVNWSHADVLSEIVPNGNGNLYTAMDFIGLRSLHLAVAGRDQDALNAAGSYGLVKMLLDAGAEVNANDNNGCSPLQCAIYTGDLELVTMLIDAGANVNNQNTIGATPLHDAVLCCCNDEMLRLLLSRGADVDAQTRDLGDTALHWASTLNIDSSHDGIVVKLLEFGSDLNKNNYLGLSAFDCIVETCDVNLVKLCIDEHKADLKKLASNGSNALSFAVLNLNENVMDLVLESGIEIDRKSRIGQTPLHSASKLSMLENVKRLISLGADVNAMDVHGLTPLAFCILGPSRRHYLGKQLPLSLDRTNFDEERRQLIRLLLDCGNDLNKRIYTKNDPQNQPSILEIVNRYVEDYETLDVVIEHVAEMEAKFNKSLLDDYNRMIFDKMLEQDPEIKSYYQICQDELMAMKTAKIEGTTISYFSVLTEPLDVVARYARNQDFVKASKAGDYQTAYDSFASKLEEKFNAAIARQKTMEQASSILSASLRFADSSHPAFEIILKYLSEADVKILIGST